MGRRSSCCRLYDMSLIYPQPKPPVSRKQWPRNPDSHSWARHLSRSCRERSCTPDISIARYVFSLPTPSLQNKHGVPTDDILNRVSRDYAVSMNRTGSHKQTYRTIAERKAGVTSYFKGGTLEVEIDGEKHTFELDGWEDMVELECREGVKCAPLDPGPPAKPCVQRRASVCRLRSPEEDRCEGLNVARRAHRYKDDRSRILNLDETKLRVLTRLLNVCAPKGATSASVSGIDKQEAVSGAAVGKQSVL